MPTLTIQGTIAFPLGAEATPPSRPFKYELVYSEKLVQDFVFTGAEVGVDLMGHIGDAKAAYLEVVAGSVEIFINGAEESIELSVDGGQWIWGNPNGGLTILSATTADDARMRVYLFA